jgi:hypothetical protein
VWDWKVNERRLANVQDSETRQLIEAGLLVIVDEETRKPLPPPAPASSKGGCGCGQ